MDYTKIYNILFGCNVLNISALCNKNNNLYITVIISLDYYFFFTIKHLKYFSWCAMNLQYMKV